MRKINKIFPILAGTTLLVPSLILASCGNNEDKKIDPIIEPTTEEKQAVCSEDSNVCSYSITLSDSITIEQTSIIEVELSDVTKSAEDISVNLVSTKATIEGKKVSFGVKIDQTSNNKTVKTVQFSVNLNCKNNSQSAWTKKITGYKIEKTFDTEKHQISTVSNINSVTIESDVEEVNETTPINLTITNSRQVDVEGASLTIIAGSNHITLPLDTLEQDNPLEILYTKADLQEKFTEAGYTIADNDPIKFQILKVGSYKVENNQLYKNNELNEFTLVSDDELDTLANRFLYQNQYGELILNDSELTFPKYIQSCTPSGNNHVYLLKTKDIPETTEVVERYFSEGANPSSGTADIYVHGILDSSGNKLSIFRTWRDYLKSGEQYNYGLGQEGIKYHMDHLIMEGRYGQGVANYYLTDGMVCPYLSCEYCDFTGSYTACITECHFKNCTFDTTNTWKGSDGSTKNNNAMFLYGGSVADFENCTFNSKGKAVKIYYGQVGAEVTYNFLFKNCQFNLANNYCNFIEYPIDIDACEHTGPTVFNITIENTTMNQLWKDKLKTICENDPTHGTYYDQLYHINDTQVTTTGQADHIIINDVHPLPFYFDPQVPLPTPTQE